MLTKEQVEETKVLFSKESHPFSRLMNKGKFFSGRISDIEIKSTGDTDSDKVFDIHEVSIFLPKETSDKAINFLKAEIDVDKETNQVAQFSLLFSVGNYQTTDEENNKRFKEEFKDYIKIDSLNSYYGDYYNFSIRFPVSAILSTSNKSFILNAKDYTLDSDKFIELFDYIVTTLLEQFRIVVVCGNYKLNELPSSKIQHLLDMVSEHTFWRYTDKYGLQSQKSETITTDYTSFPMMKDIGDNGALLIHERESTFVSTSNHEDKRYLGTNVNRNWFLPNDFSPFQFNSVAITTIIDKEEKESIFLKRENTLMQFDWVFLFGSLDDIKYFLGKRLLNVSEVIDSVADKTKEPSNSGPIRIQVGISRDDYLKIRNSRFLVFPIECSFHELSRNIIRCVKDSIVEHDLFNLKGEELKKKVKLIENKLAELRDNTLGIER